MEKASVRLPIIAFVGIYLFYGFIRMTTGSHTIGKIDAVANRGRGQLRRKNKTMLGIYRSMFLQSVMGGFIFNRPVRFQIPREFERIPVLVCLPLRGLFLLSLFLDLLITNGVTDGLNQAGINCNSFIDG